jgi:hypothetical protein
MEFEISITKSIRYIELFIIKKANAEVPRSLDIVISPSPRNEKLIKCIPSKIRTRINNPLAIASTLNHNLKTFGFSLGSGVPFKKYPNALRNGEEIVETISDKTPVIAFNITSTIPALCLTGVIFSRTGTFVFEFTFEEKELFKKFVRKLAPITITRPIKLFLINFFARSSLGIFPELVIYKNPPTTISRVLKPRDIISSPLM